jgi:hypothetical protein
VQGPALDLGAAPVAAAAEGQALAVRHVPRHGVGGVHRHGAGRLVVAAPGAVGELRVAGVAAFNVDRDVRATVMALIDGLRTDRVPMVAPRWRRPVQWGGINDGLVAEVRYLERTPTGLLRHASARRVELAD